MSKAVRYGRFALQIASAFDTACSTSLIVFLPGMPATVRSQMSRTRLLPVIALTIAFHAGCASPQPATPSPVSQAMISGVVLAEGQPLQGAQVDHGYGPNSWVFTDANGLFQLPGHAGIENYQWVRAGKPGYVQPCAAPWTPSVDVKIEMVPQATLTGTPLPSAKGFRTISGVAVQVVNGVPLPVPGVAIDFEPRQDDWPAAYTFTDANGQFSLCGLPVVDAFISAYASGPLYGSATVPPGQTAIELTLRN